MSDPDAQAVLAAGLVWLALLAVLGRNPLTRAAWLAAIARSL